MAYIGREPQVGNFQVCDAISVVNGQAAYTMQVGSVNVSPETANHVLCSVNGILQRSGSSFTVSGSTITFASNLVTGDVIDFIQILGSTLDLGVPSNDTVGAAQIKDDLISGTTALASEPADTDEFLVSDAGVLKRIDYSLIKASPGLNLISTTNVTSGVSQVDITSGIDSTYKNYQIHITNYHVATDNSKPLMRFFSSSGVLTGNNYTYAVFGRRQDGTALNDNDGGTDRFRFIDQGIGNANSEQLSIIINLFNPSGTTFQKTFGSTLVMLNASGHACSVTSAGKYADTIAITGVRFYQDSGNIDSGTFKLYGVS